MSESPYFNERNDAEVDSHDMGITLLSDPNKGTTIRASSVLQKNTKLYGPMNVLDLGNESSSWNSEGNVQTETKLIVHFGRSVIPTEIKFQFQAGFSAELVTVYDSEMTRLGDLELEDVHELQSFALLDKKCSLTGIKLVLDNFSDFYGRVIVYRLEVWGYEDPND